MNQAMASPSPDSSEHAMKLSNHAPEKTAKTVSIALSK